MLRGMVVRLGQREKGWIPNNTHFDNARKQLKASGVDKTHNIILFHYGIEVDERVLNGLHG